MFRKNEYKNTMRGFTVAELMAGAALLVITMTVAYNLYLFAKEAGMYVYTKSDLQQKAMLGLEEMIHGVDEAHKGIQEAQETTLPSAGAAATTTIVFTDGEDSSISRQFSFSGDDIVYTDENGATSLLIEGDVSALTFTRLAVPGNLIVINLTLQKSVSGKNILVALETEVELRNM